MVHKPALLTSLLAVGQLDPTGEKIPESKSGEMVHSFLTKSASRKRTQLTTDCSPTTVW